jgi:hypothetical protein
MSENERKGKLRLFVVGESSGDPADWSEYPCRAYVIAGSAEEAVRMLGDRAMSGVAEVRFDKPVTLCVDESGLADSL